MQKLVNPQLAEQISLAADPETDGAWPTERLKCLREAGVFRWGLPHEFGGIEVSGGEMLDGYVDLARVCLSSAFILTQRNAACHRIAACENRELRQRLLPDHCAGRAFATVGISHLSTSRQHWSRPSVAARQTASGFELSGEAPWVTGARHADLLVTGGTLEDGRQILAAIPTNRSGVSLGEPLRLLALNESHTGSVLLDRVAIGCNELLGAPIANIMKTGATGGTGSLTTTAVAVGAAMRNLDGILRETTSRKELTEPIGCLLKEQSTLHADLLRAASVPLSESESRVAAEQLRHRANSLVARTAQAYMSCAKGAGFLAGHPAERAVREAMFFQVWSCPPAVTVAALKELADAI